MKRVLPYLLLLPGLGLVMLFMVSVLYRAFAQSFGLYNFGGEDAFSLHHWQEMLARPRFWRAFWYSSYIATTSALLSVALAYPLALWMRKPFRGSMLLSALIKAPMLVPGLVAAFLFVNVISYHGFLNQIMMGLGLWDAPRRMQNDASGYGVIFLQVWKNLPFAFLLLSGAVASLPDPVLNAARDLGAGTWSRFRKVVVPMTAGAMQASLILIFIGAAGDFSFQSVAGPVRLNSMATLMTQVQTTDADWNGAAVIAVMLMGLALFGSILLAIVVHVASWLMGGTAPATIRRHLRRARTIPNQPNGGQA
ncbi:ABC transporter permease [Paracoccus sp. (in: a-proteobacteria)]|uniref:ABC transporter permease n=1 Tax=Paracoccus sp. TaxID=267 RepID=UPI0026DEC744|nr:ABC transporter permease [Paracoccus sp. (in: a-proteobacteria)]MDO5647530.1 ABC transporter permease [Paracoccus sp. (in: a-proteobacteria)]